MGIIVAQRVLTMIIIIFIGCICFKYNLITKKGGKDLSNLLMYVVNPLLILLAFQRDYSKKLLIGFLITFVVSAAALGVMILLANLITFRRKGEFAIEKYGLIFRNCGFFGIPLVTSIYGIDGVFYLSAFMSAFNLLNWSYGISIMKGSGEKIQFKEMMKNMINPTIVGTIIGFILFLCHFTIPGIFSESFEFVSAMNTPLAMIIAGVALAENHIMDIIKNTRVLFITFLLLVVVPLFVIVPLSFLPIDEKIRVVVSIAVACPAGTTINAFALKFDKNSAYASQIFSVTTLFSAISIPLIMMIY